MKFFEQNIRCMMDCPLYIKMKIFYKVPLKGFNENLPIEFAKKIFLKESPFLQYLNDNKALRMRFNKPRNLLELHAPKKWLMLAILKYKHVLPGRMTFMDIFIQHQLKRRMELSKGST